MAIGIDDSAAENSTAKRYRSGSWDGSEWEVLIDEVKQRMSELAVESGHHLSKKAKEVSERSEQAFWKTRIRATTKLNIIPLNSFSRLLRSAQLQRSTFREYMSTVVVKRTPRSTSSFQGGR